MNDLRLSCSTFVREVGRLILCIVSRKGKRDPTVMNLPVSFGLPVWTSFTLAHLGRFYTRLSPPRPFPPDSLDRP